MTQNGVHTAMGKLPSQVEEYFHDNKMLCNSPPNRVICLGSTLASPASIQGHLRSPLLDLGSPAGGDKMGNRKSLAKSLHSSIDVFHIFHYVENKLVLNWWDWLGFSELMTQHHVSFFHDYLLPSQPRLCIHRTNAIVATKYQLPGRARDLSRCRQNNRNAWMKIGWVESINGGSTRLYSNLLHAQKQMCNVFFFNMAPLMVSVQKKYTGTWF